MLYFQLCYLWAILSCLLLHPHPCCFFSLFIFPLFPPFVLLTLYLSSWRVTQSVCLLMHLFPVPLSLPPQLILKASPGTVKGSAHRSDPAVSWSSARKKEKHPVCLHHVLSLSTVPLSLLLGAWSVRFLCHCSDVPAGFAQDVGTSDVNQGVCLCPLFT